MRTVSSRQRHIPLWLLAGLIGLALAIAGLNTRLVAQTGVLGERPAVLARPGPVGVGDLGDHLAAFFEGFENDADIEVLAERGLDADLNVVEVDEDGDF